jgi:hypothetical protein
MTSATLDKYAFSRRQYSLLLHRRLRTTRREYMRVLFAAMARRCLAVFLFGCSIAVFSLSLFGWMGM